MSNSPIAPISNHAPARAFASRSEDWPAQLLSACAAALIVWLIGQLLMIRTDYPEAVSGVRTQLSFIERASRFPPRSQPPMVGLKPATVASSSQPAHAPRPIDEGQVAPLVGRLFTPEGRVNLPPGLQIDPHGTAPVGSPPGLPGARSQALAKRLLERPNPIDYRPTRFEKSWATDGTLGDALVESMDEGLKGMAGALAGRQEQPARARAPPEVRFNPGLHQRPSDLGSEATGDAYKAAPIAFEKAPALDGEASRRLRGELASLQTQFAHCSAQRWLQAVGPVNAHLADLERIEYAYGHGADPVQAEHLLPRSADMAFDLTRRALWHAQRRLATCPG